MFCVVRCKCSLFFSFQKREKKTFVIQLREINVDVCQVEFKNNHYSIWRKRFYNIYILIETLIRFIFLPFQAVICSFVCDCQSRHHRHIPNEIWSTFVFTSFWLHSTEKKREIECNKEAKRIHLISRHIRNGNWFRFCRAQLTNRIQMRFKVCREKWKKTHDRQRNRSVRMDIKF